MGGSGKGDFTLKMKRNPNEKKNRQETENEISYIRVHSITSANELQTKRVSLRTNRKSREIRNEKIVILYGIFRFVLSVKWP